MRKSLMSFMTVLFAVATFASQAQAQVRFEVAVPEPFKVFGIGPKTGIGITNATPFYVKFVVVDQELRGCYHPGASIYDRRGMGFGSEDLPVAARFYQSADCDGSSMVGLGGTVMRLSEGQTTTWTINAYNVCFLDGRSGMSYSGVNPYPSGNVGDAEEVSMPRLVLEPQTVVQILNCSFHPAEVRLDRSVVDLDRQRQPLVLAPGGIFATVITARWVEGRSVPIGLIYTDRGGFIGSWQNSFWLSSNLGQGPKAQQFLVSLNQIQRPY